jgi:hypothetical protein
VPYQWKIESSAAIWIIHPRMAAAQVRPQTAPVVTSAMAGALVPLSWGIETNLVLMLGR